MEQEQSTPVKAVRPPQHVHHRDVSSFDERFEPLRPEDRWKVAVGAIVGPVLWIGAFLVAAWLVAVTDAIELGMLVTLAAFVLSLLLLTALRIGRGREERRRESSDRA